MAVYFLDSSALVKRYIRETGTDWVASLFSPDFGNDCFVAAIAGVEIIAAITRRARSGSLKAADATLVCATVSRWLRRQCPLPNKRFAAFNFCLS